MSTERTAAAATTATEPNVIAPHSKIQRIQTEFFVGLLSDSNKSLFREKTGERQNHAFSALIPAMCFAADYYGVDREQIAKWANAWVKRKKSSFFDVPDFSGKLKLEKAMLRGLANAGSESVEGGKLSLPSAGSLAWGKLVTVHNAVHRQLAAPTSDTTASNGLAPMIDDAPALTEAVQYQGYLRFDSRSRREVFSVMATLLDALSPAVPQFHSADGDATPVTQRDDSALDTKSIGAAANVAQPTDESLRPPAKSRGKPANTKKTHVRHGAGGRHMPKSWRQPTQSKTRISRPRNDDLSNGRARANARPAAVTSQADNGPAADSPPASVVPR